jgi:hypothetical protein
MAGWPEVGNRCMMDGRLEYLFGRPRQLNALERSGKAFVFGGGRLPGRYAGWR